MSILIKDLNYEWAMGTKFLIAVAYRSPRRHSNSSNTFRAALIWICIQHIYKRINISRYIYIYILCIHIFIISFSLWSHAWYNPAPEGTGILQRHGLSSARNRVPKLLIFRRLRELPAVAVCRQASSLVLGHFQRGLRGGGGAAGGGLSCGRRQDQDADTDRWEMR